jgi:hypothetical protein
MANIVSNEVSPPMIHRIKAVWDEEQLLWVWTDPVDGSKYTGVDGSALLEAYHRVFNLEARLASLTPAQQRLVVEMITQFEALPLPDPLWERFFNPLETALAMEFPHALWTADSSRRPLQQSPVERADPTSRSRMTRR